MLNLEKNWFKSAVFYELFVRGFFDSNNDGIGDLPGLISKLDYLQSLGVDCLWLLPINKSPLKDAGYDVSDYYEVQPEYGTIEDVSELLWQAHDKGMRVIMDLVLNHTSDKHPWFEESRSSRDNPKRDWYIWSDDPSALPEARVIFSDTEKSNWVWDQTTEQYYFHRFFNHQPDLNYDNPEVQAAMLSVVRFWLELGIDGFRLDAVPYLFAREGTNCENLPETHNFLARIRELIETEFNGDRVLLAEANQWPEDVVDYFGSPEHPECHMCFNFPLMPRMFIAVRKESRKPITDILTRTPRIDDNSQWGIFLRNHDELTLEMVSQEERDFLWTEYAKDPRMKLNLGIRRRLAPLLKKSRRQIELFHGMLLSLPGTPILYYGDEIGMGDNVFLGDRDGVRTPMQWSGDRNAGFSKCDFAQLYLPPLMDSVYGFQAINVEAQQRHEYSFFHWVQGLIKIRHTYPVFGLGDFKHIKVENERIFAYLRFDENTNVLCVNNLSSKAQAVELNLAEFNGKIPLEMMGGENFPVIEQRPYVLTLAPHSFYWFDLR